MHEKHDTVFSSETWDGDWIRGIHNRKYPTTNKEIKIRRHSAESPVSDRSSSELLSSMSGHLSNTTYDISSGTALAKHASTPSKMISVGLQDSPISGSTPFGIQAAAQLYNNSETEDKVKMSPLAVDFQRPPLLVTLESSYSEPSVVLNVFA